MYLNIYQMIGKMYHYEYKKRKVKIILIAISLL